MRILPFSEEINLGSENIFETKLNWKNEFREEKWIRRVILYKLDNNLQPPRPPVGIGKYPLCPRVTGNLKYKKRRDVRVKQNDSQEYAGCFSALSVLLSTILCSKQFFSLSVHQWLEPILSEVRMLRYSPQGARNCSNMPRNSCLCILRGLWASILVEGC